MTVNAEEMIDLRDFVNRKSIHSGLDCITDGPIGGTLKCVISLPFISRRFDFNFFFSDIWSDLRSW